MSRGRFSDEKCPKCGSNLLTNGEHYWCSFIGGRNGCGEKISGCDFGIRSDVNAKKLEQVRDAKKLLYEPA